MTAKRHQQTVLNHARMQEGHEAAAFNRAFAHFVDAAVNHPVVIFKKESGNASVDEPVHKQAVQIVEVPALGKELV